MQERKLKNISYHYLEKAFSEWLDVLGYAPKTVYSLPRTIKYFLHFLDTQGVSKINLLQTNHLNDYQQYVKLRISKKTQLALSSNYINHHFWAIEKFFNFLHHKGITSLPDINFKYLKVSKTNREILSKQEIKELYEIAENQPYITKKQEAINYSDLVLLSMYYACGLRRTEGVQLKLSDINLDTKILHVKKGKGGKQRLIPFNKTTATYLQNWIYEYRDILIKDKTASNLFINIRGNTATGGSLNRRLHALTQQSENIDLKQKNITLHSLRHSIATHLLANGMNIQKVQQFLGHSSLGTTEIYTHLIEELAQENNNK